MPDELKRQCLRCTKDFLPSQSSSETGHFCQVCVNEMRIDEQREQQEKAAVAMSVVKRPVTFSLSAQTVAELNEIRLIEQKKNTSAVISFLTEKYYSTWRPKKESKK